MYGLDAISAHNGWAMAFAGALIVVSGLAVLSFVISQLHRIVDLLEKRDKTAGQPGLDKPDARTAAAPQRPALNVEAHMETYRALAEELDDLFELTALYALAREKDLPHTHLTIRSLRETGIIVPVGDGKFKWQR